MIILFMVGQKVVQGLECISPDGDFHVLIKNPKVFGRKDERQTVISDAHYLLSWFGVQGLGFSMMSWLKALTH